MFNESELGPIRKGRRTRSRSHDDSLRKVGQADDLANGWLPDLDPLIFVQPEGIGVCYLEGGVELRKIPNDLIAAELRG
jgi:hypothetical protein